MTGRQPHQVDGIVLDTVDRAIADIAAGRPVVVVDDADRENEGDIIFAASKATPALLAFTIRHTSGVICVPMLGEELDRLELPLMTTQNNERMRTAFTVSVDARDRVTTGISAADRARTVRTSSACTDLNRPAARPEACEPGVRRSRTTTDRPCSAQCRAVLSPRAPAPTTATSAFMTSAPTQPAADVPELPLRGCPGADGDKVTVHWPDLPRSPPAQRPGA